MDFTIKLHNIRTVDRLEGFWSSNDYVKLLERFDFADAAGIPEPELAEMLLLAISDFEPDEAAEIVLTYKLEGKLSENQIKNLSHEMLQDKVAEEYPDIALHCALFHINRLLYDAYNGKFPLTRATVIDLELALKGPLKVDKEIVLRTLSDLLSPKSLLKRLFETQLDSEHEFTDAGSIIWELSQTGENTYRIISSDYWLNREDFETDEYSGQLEEDEIDHLQ